MGTNVNVEDLRGYVKTLDHYGEEAGKFGDLVGRADVTNESWGLIGLAVKQQYTEKLDELNDLLSEMQSGLAELGTKVGKAADVYEGNEQDNVVAFGEHQAELDGPK